MASQNTCVSARVRGAVCVQRSVTVSQRDTACLYVLRHYALQEVKTQRQEARVMRAARTMPRCYLSRC